MMLSKITTLFSAIILLPALVVSLPAADSDVAERGDSTTVSTPHGAYPAANVHEIPEDGGIKLVGNEIHLLNATGAVVHTATNDHTVVKPPTSKPKRAIAAREQSGWIAYAWWQNQGNSPISSFSASWTVPRAPKTYHSQTIYLYLSLIPDSGDSVLLATLQYGTQLGGSPTWSAASWYRAGSQVYHTRFHRVKSGDVLHGVLELVDSEDNSYDYSARLDGIKGTRYSIYGSDELTYATETLESYGVQVASDYPRGSTVFGSINVKLDSRRKPHVNWQTESDDADGIEAIVNRQGSSNAKVTIDY